MVPPVFVLLRLCTTVVQDGSPKKVVLGPARMKRKKPPSGDEGSRYYIWNSSYSFRISFRDTRTV